MKLITMQLFMDLFSYLKFRQRVSDIAGIRRDPTSRGLEGRSFRTDHSARALQTLPTQHHKGWTVCTSVVSLHEFYFFHFKISSNLIDTIISRFTETSLNADEAYIVGLVAYNEDKFQHAFLWFLYSLDRLTQYSTVTEEELLRYLSDSAYHFDSLPVAIYFGQRLLNMGELMVTWSLILISLYQKSERALLQSIFTHTWRQELLMQKKVWTYIILQTYITQ